MAYTEEVSMMMSVVPGSLTGISALMGGLSSITNVFTDITRQVDATFGLIDTSIITASTIVAQFGLSAAEAAGQFEQGLKVAQMVSGQTAQEMDYLRQKANEFSVSYRVDIDQITEGLQTLGRAGLNSASEQTEVLQNGLSTAKLEGRDLNGVLEELIQNTALLGGNLKSSDFGELSGYLNDVMVATSMTAPITTHDVSETLKYSGGIAAAAGADVNTDEGKALIEDYMGAIAAFAQKGVTGSIAGTALRAFFNKPATQDSSVKDALASIKLKPEYLWEEDEQTMKPVSEQISIIEGQMEKLNISTMDQLQIWSKIVGGKMGQQMMKLHSEDIKELTNDIRAADDAQSLAEGTFDTYQAKMKETTEQGQVAFRQFGEYAAKVLTPLLDVLKNIFAFFSNPIASGGAFVAAIALIFSGISKIKNVFSSLKQEFATIMHYVKTGEHLMAYRPSTDRKTNRFKRESLERKYPGISPLSAYSKERKVAYEEGLINKYGQEKAFIYSSADKLKGTSFEDRNYWFLKRMFPSDGGYTKKDRSDAGIVKYLIENDLWKEEFSKTLEKNNGDLKKTLLAHDDEIVDLIDMGQDKIVAKIEEKRKAIFESFVKNEEEIKKMEEKVAADPSLANVYDQKQSYKKGMARQRKLNFFNEMGFQDLSRLNYEKMDAEIDAYKVTKENENSVSYSRSSIARKFNKQYINSFIKQFDDKARLFTFIENDDDLKLFMKYLKANNLSTGHPEFDFKIQEAIWNEAQKQRNEAASAFVEKQKKIFEEKGLEFNPGLYGLLSDSMFGEVVNAPSAVDINTLRRAFLREAGIVHYDDAIKAIKPMMSLRRRRSKTKEPFEFVSEEELGQMFPDANSRDIHLLYEQEGIKGFDPFEAAARKERERKKAEDNAKLDKIIQDRNKRRYEDFDYWTASELLLKHNQLPEEKQYLKLRDIPKKIKEIYGKGHARQFYGKTRLEMGKLAYPYLADWSLTEEQGGMSDTEFNRFAAGFGAKINPNNSRQNQIEQLNEHLSLKEKQNLEKDINKLEEERTKQAKILIDYYKEQNKLLEEQMAYHYSHFDNPEKDNLQPEIKWDEVVESSQKSSEKYKERQWRNYHNRNNVTYDESGNLVTNKSAEFLREKEKEKEANDEVFKRMTTQFDSDENDKLARAIFLRYRKEKEDADKEAIRLANEYKNNMDLLPRVDKGFSIYDEKKTGLAHLKNKISQPLSSVFNLEDGLLRTGYDNFTKRLKADRSDSFLNFGKGSKANSFLNALDMFGGPFLVATEAATAAIELWKQAFENYCEDLKKAGDQLKEAYSEWNSAEDALRRTYQEGNPDATSEEIDDMVLETYSTMNDDMVNAFNNGEQEWFRKINKQGATADNYVLDEEANDGSTKVEEKEEPTTEQAYQEAIKENTGALYRATAELSVAMSNYTRKMEDSWWGLDGWTGDITNAFGSFQDDIEKNGIFGPSSQEWNNPFGNRLGSRYSDNNEFLLTAQQKDENYSGYTEMAGLMLEDIKDAKGNWIKGMRTMMGEDVEVINDVMSQGAKDFLKNTGQNFIGKLTPNQNATLQASMKNDTKTWKKLGKEIAKYEMKNQKSVGKTSKQSTKKIEGLINKLNTSMGSKFDRTQILQAAYLMEMQEMYQVAQNTMVPLIQQNAESVANTLLTAQGIGEQTNGTGSYTSSTAAIASSIAAMVSVIAMAKSGEAYYNQLNMSDPTKLSPEEKAAYDLAQESDNAQDFMKKAGAKAYDKVHEWSFAGNLDTTGPIPGFMSKKDAETQNAKNQAAMAGILKNYMATAKMTVYGYDTEKAISDADAYVSNALKNGASPMDLYKTIAKNYQSPEFLNKLVGAYLASGEEGEGAGGGSGSGSGSGNDNDNTGTKKERVDLVLCSKKEIPKLNVNLFKKPPTFTVLNKNFKVRDVKINTEDTPKAIMSSIKNAFIDVQKRSDPKIIQDEEAVYDPNGATDGNPLPSGSAKTKTDQT